MGAELMPYDVVIFDLDGTLTDSEPGIVRCVQYALDAMNVAHEHVNLRAFVGPPLYDSFTELFGLKRTEAHRAIDLYRERYFTTGFLENRVYPGIPALLRTLKAHGVTVAVATAKPHPVCDQVLEAFDLIKYIDVVAAPGTENESSDKSRLIRQALPNQYRRACMVGDRKFDMAGGVACGIDAIGALYGYGSREELSESGATILVDSVAHLTKLLLGGAPVARGAFITLEGSDGSGKSTQHRLLGEWLADCGHEVVLTREPGGCPISERIRSIVLDAREMGMSDACEALLFAAARAQHVHEVIRPALSRGAVVLCDRFVDSSIAYQGIGRGLGADLVARINAPAVDACLPDLTVLLDIDPDEAMNRRVAAEAPDRIEKADAAFIKRVYDGYRGLAEHSPERFRVVDALGAPEDVSARIRAVVSEAVFPQ